MTINNALKWAIKKLERRTNSASLDAEILLSHVLQKSKEFLYTHPDNQLTKNQLKKFEKLVNQRLKNVPVAYLTGDKEFYGLKFLVNKHVLIPRPESEAIINKALDLIKRYTIPARHASCQNFEKIERVTGRQNTRYTICDIGTGSGCLIISLAKELQKSKIINNFKLVATDISKKALKVAKQNAKLHQVHKYITFLKGDLLKPLKNRDIDLIITNLPYLTKADTRKEPSIKKEPRRALVGTYDKFFKQLDLFSKKPTVLFENKKGVKIIR